MPRPILQWVTKINAFSRPGVEKLRRRAVSELWWWFAPSIGLFYHLVQLPCAKFTKVCKPNVNAWSPCLTASFDLICHIPACNLSWSFHSYNYASFLHFFLFGDFLGLTSRLVWTVKWITIPVNHSCPSSQFLIYSWLRDFSRNGSVCNVTLPKS